MRSWPCDRTRLLRSMGATLAILACACSDAPRVGVVDVQEAFQRSPLVMVSAHRIESELGDAERDLKKRGRALAELRKEVEHGGLPREDARRRELAARIEEEGARLAELQRRYRDDLAAVRERAGREMIARVEEVAREVAQSQGLDVLVRRSDLLYERPGADLDRIDVTAQVARALLDRINPSEIPEPPAEPDP